MFILILSAMMLWVPPEQHRFREKEEVTVARYMAIAKDIVHVVSTDQGRLVRSREMEAVLLASIASFESAYRADVDECRKGLGGAWSIFQIAGGRERSKKNVCSSLREAARVALHMVRESFQECAHLPFEDRLSFYTDGKCHPQWKRSRVRVQRAVKFMQSAGLGGA